MSATRASAHAQSLFLGAGRVLALTLMIEKDTCPSAVPTGPARSKSHQPHRDPGLPVLQHGSPNMVGNTTRPAGLWSSLIQIKGKGTFYCLSPNRALPCVAFPML